MALTKMEGQQEKNNRMFLKKAIGIWAVVSFAIPVLMFQPMIIEGAQPIDVSIESINLIAEILVFGLPFFLGTAIFFSPMNVNYGFREPPSRSNDRRLFLIRFSSFWLLCSLYLVILTIAGFVSLAVRYNVDLSLVISSMLRVSVAAPIIALLLCPIPILLSVVIDNWKLTTALGCILFFVIAFATGMPRFPLKYPELALIGPVQLYRAIALFLSGIVFPTSSAMINIFGIYIMIESIVLPTAVFTLVAILSLWVSLRVLPQNYERWVLEQESWRGVQAVTDTSQRTTAMKN
ncbi:MAG: hypothetical protein RTU92_13070 [Candidatus Thorarchaeota archaeon]